MFIKDIQKVKDYGVDVIISPVNIQIEAFSEDFLALFKIFYLKLKYGGLIALFADSDKADLLTYHARKTGFEIFQKLYWVYKLEHQIVEEIVIFKKPCKYKSVLNDIFAKEKGDIKIHPAVFGIDQTRVSTTDIRIQGAQQTAGVTGFGGNNRSGGKIYNKGRFTPQTIITPSIAKYLDNTYGVKKSVYRKASARPRNNGIGLGNTIIRVGTSNAPDNYGDKGGISKMFPIIPYEVNDIIPYYYCPKVSKKERNEGLDDFESKEGQRFSQNPKCTLCGKHRFSGNPCKCSNPRLILENKPIEQRKNHHPTVKPIALMEWLIKLFTMEGQIVLDPFAGSFTTGVACKRLNRQFIGIELNAEYVEIGKARLKAEDKKKAEAAKKEAETLKKFLQ